MGIRFKQPHIAPFLMMSQTAWAVNVQPPVLCRHWRLVGLFDHLICSSNILQHGWLDPMRYMHDSKASNNWRSCIFRLIRLTSFSLRVVCTFASSTDIFFLSPYLWMVVAGQQTCCTLCCCYAFCSYIRSSLNVEGFVTMCHSRIVRLVDETFPHYLIPRKVSVCCLPWGVNIPGSWACGRC